MSEGLIRDGYGDTAGPAEQDLSDQQPLGTDLTFQTEMLGMSSDEIATYIETHRDNLQLAKQAASILRERLYSSTSPKEHHDAANRIWFVIYKAL